MENTRRLTQVHDRLAKTFSNLFTKNAHTLPEVGTFFHIEKRFKNLTWYRWALDRLGLKYQYQRFGLRNTVERFLKQRTMQYHA